MVSDVTNMSNSIEYKWLQVSQIIQPFYLTKRLQHITNLSQNGTGYKGLLQIPQNSMFRSSPSDGLVSYQDIYYWGRVLLLCTDAFSVFYSPKPSGIDR